jgi:hypothetical protein
MRVSSVDSIPTMGPLGTGYGPRAQSATMCDATTPSVPAAGLNVRPSAGASATGGVPPSTGMATLTVTFRMRNAQRGNR